VILAGAVSHFTGCNLKRFPTQLSMMANKEKSKGQVGMFFCFLFWAAFPPFWFSSSSFGSS